MKMNFKWTFSHICLLPLKLVWQTQTSSVTLFRETLTNYPVIELRWCLTTVKFPLLWMKKLKENHSIPIVALLISVNELLYCFRLCSPASGYVTGLTSWLLTSATYKKAKCSFPDEAIMAKLHAKKTQYLKLKSFFHALCPWLRRTHSYNRNALNRTKNKGKTQTKPCNVIRSFAWHYERWSWISFSSIAATYVTGPIQIFPQCPIFIQSLCEKPL